MPKLYAGRYDLFYTVWTGCVPLKPTGRWVRSLMRYASCFFQDLGPIWTEALLSVDLSSRERKVWASKLETWQQEIVDYGVEEVFEAAHEAALRGWDDPQLQHVLQGTDIENDSWDGEVSEVTVARLHVLERLGRLQEYLHLARAQGQNEAYVAMLVRLGRTQEAVAYGR